MTQHMASEKRLIVSVSSDIGSAVARHWISQGHTVVGTYRTPSTEVDSLIANGCTLIHCDLSSAASIDAAISECQKPCRDWTCAAFLAGSMEPLARFESCAFSSWEHSIEVNLLRPLRFLHAILPLRSKESKLGPLIIFTAGAGTNSAPTHVSAYTISKIALIKTCELLQAECSDLRCVIAGPGWVKSKIHNQALQAGVAAGPIYEQTKERFRRDDFAPVSRFLDFLDWAESQSSEIVGGRNFSVVNDAWGSPLLEAELARDPEMYKLRRSRNTWSTFPIQER